MGQKVSPTGLRIGINKDWESKWYAENDFAKYLHTKIKHLLHWKNNECVQRIVRKVSTNVLKMTAKEIKHFKDRI